MAIWLESKEDPLADRKGGVFAVFVGIAFHSLLGYFQIFPKATENLLAISKLVVSGVCEAAGVK